MVRICGTEVCRRSRDRQRDPKIQRESIPKKQKRPSDSYAPSEGETGKKKYDGRWSNASRIIDSYSWTLIEIEIEIEIIVTPCEP